MAGALYLETGYRAQATRRERAASLALALGFTFALILLLIRLGAIPLPGARIQGALTTFTFKGEPEAPKRAVERPQTRKASAASAPKARPLVQTTTSPVPVPNWTPTDASELAALDTAMATAHGYRAARATGDGNANADSDGGGGGGGAGGAAGDRLFAADWYKRPSDAELDPYLGQARARSGWGEIACRTAPRFRVEDCRELEESPGSGIARALREAAWQFQVLPPRVNGRPIVGAWVRIHFDLIDGFRGG